MATSTIIVCGLVFLVGAVLTGLLMSVANRWLNIASANFFNSTIAAVGAGVVALAMECVRGIGEGWLPGGAVPSSEGVTVGASIPLLAIQLLLTLLLILWVVKTVMFATWPEGVKAGLAMVVLGGLVVFGLDWVVQRSVAQRVRSTADDMAPMILGSHARVTCEKCAQTYPVAAPNPAAIKRGKAPSSYATTCPVCGQANSLPAEAKAFAGDCLSVSKSREPERWDLILTKIPADSSICRVCRVVGLPGETIDIADGHLFLNKKRLQRKPGEAEDMWIPINDTRVNPGATTKSETPRWKTGRAGSGWKFEDDSWLCTNDRTEPDTLVFSGKITDRLSYNPRSSGEEVSERPVGDVKIDCSVKSLINGTMTLDWGFYEQGVMVTITHEGDLEMTVFARPAGRTARRLGSTRAKLSDPMSRSNRIGFVVRDGLAAVTERDAVIVSMPVGPQDLETVKQNASDAIDHCRLMISVASGSLSLSRIQLYRDVYYRRVEGLPPQALAGVDPKYLPGGKGTPYVKLRDDMFFVLSDNSARGRDSRMIGPLQRDDILGIPRGIYIPFGRWHMFK